RIAPTYTVLIEQETELQPSASPLTPVEIVRYEREQIDLKADLKTAGILLLNDRFHPRWEASVNGKPARILRCNAVMRGVELEKGTHEVRFTYRKPPQVQARFHAFIAALVILAAWGLLRWRFGSNRMPPAQAS
ncbi:MAG: hypothetical protein AAF492_05660, partial [Verrucomicrobiota bacterium]